MAFKRFAAFTLMTTIARIILAAAFISLGYNKLFTEASFSAEEASILRAYGVEVEPEVVDGDEDVAWDEGSADARLASYFQEAGVTAPPLPAEEEPAPEEPTPDEETAARVDGEQPPVDPGTARSLYKVSIMTHNAGLPFPRWGAWIAALTEFIGGILLLLGFLSRIWALGLTILLGVAFYVATMLRNGFIVGDDGWNLIAFSRDVAAFNTMFNQLGLCALALFILMVGPGPLSLDRLFFGKAKRKHQERAQGNHDHGQAWHSAASRGVAAPPAQAGAIPNVMGTRPGGSPPPGRPTSPMGDAQQDNPSVTHPSTTTPPPPPSENVPLEEQRGVRGEKPSSPQPEHHPPHGDKNDDDEHQLPPRRPL